MVAEPARSHFFFLEFKQEISLLICWGLSAGLISIVAAVSKPPPPAPRAVLRGSVCSWKKMFKKVIDGESVGDAGDWDVGARGRGRCSLPLGGERLLKAPGCALGSA